MMTRISAAPSARLSRRFFLQTALGTTLVAVTAGTLLAPTALQAATPDPQGVLNQLLPWEPNSLSLLNAADSAIASVSPKIVEGLVDFDLDMNPIPALATAWDISADGLTYVFTLREGVTWHDGKPFTAADVVTSLQILKEFHPRGRVTFAGLTAVEATSSHSVTLTLSAPVPYLLLALMAEQSPIVPAHLYQAGVNPAENPANNAPVGTGPFRFVEWQRGSHIRLERNPAYWDAGKPLLAEVWHKVIPDLGARSAAFETGQVNFGGDSPLSLAEIKRFESLPDFTVERRGYSYSPSVISLFFNLESEALKDLRVRQAIAYTIDQKIIVNLAWQGYALDTPSVISPELAAWHKSDVTTYPVDADKARALLAEAGFGPGGNKLSLKLVYSTAQTPDAATGAYLKQALAKIGIELTLSSSDQPSFVKQVFGDRDFDMYLAGYNNGADPTIGVQRAFWSKSFKAGVPYSNGSAYVNPRVDALLEAAAIEADGVKRKAMWDEFQQIISDDLPCYPLVSKQSVSIIAGAVHDATVTAAGPKANFATTWIAAKA